MKNKLFLWILPLCLSVGVASAETPAGGLSQYNGLFMIGTIVFGALSLIMFIWEAIYQIQARKALSSESKLNIIGEESEEDQHEDPFKALSKEAKPKIGLEEDDESVLPAFLRGGPQGESSDISVAPFAPVAPVADYEDPFKKNLQSGAGEDSDPFLRPPTGSLGDEVKGGGTVKIAPLSIGGGGQGGFGAGRGGISVEPVQESPQEYGAGVGPKIPLQSAAPTAPLSFPPGMMDEGGMEEEGAFPGPPKISLQVASPTSPLSYGGSGEPPQAESFGPVSTQKRISISPMAPMDSGESFSPQAASATQPLYLEGSGDIGDSGEQARGDSSSDDVVMKVSMVNKLGMKAAPREDSNKNPLSLSLRGGGVPPEGADGPPKLTLRGLKSTGQSSGEGAKLRLKGLGKD